jgi:uncharacterized protein DUF4491
VNIIGPVAALSAFIAVWFGHVAVRKIEFLSPSLWFPAIVFCSLGIVAELLSLTARALSISTALGIAGITLLWDSLELVRQERRVHKGHARANPRNPRHAAFLTESGSRATTVDLLKREREDRAGNRPRKGIEDHGIIY